VTPHRGVCSSWSPFLGSLINLAAITVERYLKVVHAVWANKHLHGWIIYLVIAFAWIGGTVVAVAVTVNTTGVLNDVCYTLVLWKSQTDQKAFGIWYFLTFYVIILLIFIFCYTRILLVIRHQAQVMAAHSAAGSSGTRTTQTQSSQIQTNVIKTMMLVSLMFAVTMAPVSVYLLLMNIHSELPLGGSGFYTTVVLGYLYTCANPFIYATKFDPVKRVLRRLCPCKISAQQQASDNVQMT